MLSISVLTQDYLYMIYQLRYIIPRSTPHYRYINSDISNHTKETTMLQLPRSEALRTIRSHQLLKVYDDIESIIFHQLDEEDQKLCVLLSVAHAVGTAMCLIQISSKGISKDCSEFTDSIMRQLEEFTEDMKNRYPPKELDMHDVLMKMLSMNSSSIDEDN